MTRLQLDIAGFQARLGAGVDRLLRGEIDPLAIVYALAAEDAPPPPSVVPPDLDLDQVLADLQAAAEQLRTPKPDPACSVQGLTL
jgi:hypothetical protein